MNTPTEKPLSSINASAQTQGTENYPLLQVQSLSAFFSGTQVLRNIHFDVQTGEVVAFIGPSGCGKSTLLRCLNRLHEEVTGATSTGQVLLNGQNIYNRQTDPVLVRRQIGMVFQKPNPFPGLSVFNNVALGLKLMGVRKRDLGDKVEQALRQAALWEEVHTVLKRPGTSLSGGQQQRLCIARALAVKPSVLLMDEPTSALDPVSTARIEHLIRELKNQVTVLMVTHNMQQASRISNKTALLLSGELVEYGKTSTIFTNPLDKRTEDYITGRFG